MKPRKRKRVMFRRESEPVRLIALAQPHRRGSDDYRRSSAYGRALLDGLMRVPGYDLREAYRASELFCRALSDYRWALDSRLALSKRTAVMTRELTPARARKMIKIWGRLSEAVGESMPSLVFFAEEPPEQAVIQPAVYAVAGFGLALVANFYRLPKGGTT